MKDQRGKRVDKGIKVSALVAAGAQIVGRVVKVKAEAILFEAEIGLPVMPEQPAGVLVLVGEGIEEAEKERWNALSGRKIKLMDQRDNPITEGEDIVALMPAYIQIVGTVTEAIDPRLHVTRAGKHWQQGSITMTAYISLAVANSRVACLLLPSKEEEDSRRDDAGIIVVN